MTDDTVAGMLVCSRGVYLLLCSMHASKKFFGIHNHFSGTLTRWGLFDGYAAVTAPTFHQVLCAQGREKTVVLVLFIKIFG